ncbi:MAG: mechanosensitive ion channel family protein [Bacteroidales bacterium]|nr:mechanosensitive ion channel family protein [Bacteroidales bacterium]
MLLLQAEATGNEIFKNIVNWFTTNGLNAVQKIVIAIIVLWIGFKVIGFVKRKLQASFEKHTLDATLRPVIISIVTVALKILLIIAVISYIGIPMTSFVALLGAAGLAFGMALSGTIQNFAGGILILVFRPFKLGDYIATQGFEGTVMSIKIFSTTINTVDNKEITLPNGSLSAGNITNYSAMENRRVDIKLQVAAGNNVNLQKIEADIKAICAQNVQILQTPETSVWFHIGPGTVTIETRAWCKVGDYWTVYDYLQRAIYDYNVREGLPCPYTVIDWLKKQE